MPSEGPSLGEQLLASGWKQGCLLPDSAPMLYVERVPGSPPSWAERRRDTTGALVLATQTCDLKKHPSEEPTVEFLRAFWTTNQRITVPAAKNSVKHFLLRERTAAGGQPEGLVAEASKRVLIDKRSLQQFTPEAGCQDPQREQRFRKWLGRRYDRPAVPEAIVLAVLKPVVEGLREAAEDAAVWGLLRGVREILFDTVQTAPPFKVRFLFVREDELTDASPISDADAERLAAFLSGVLTAGGDAELDEWDAADTSSISLRDYLTFIPMPLDEYSL